MDEKILTVYATRDICSDGGGVMNRRFADRVSPFETYPCATVPLLSRQCIRNYPRPSDTLRLSFPPISSSAWLQDQPRRTLVGGGRRRRRWTGGGHVPADRNVVYMAYNWSHVLPHHPRRGGWFRMAAQTPPEKVSRRLSQPQWRGRPTGPQEMALEARYSQPGQWAGQLYYGVLTGDIYLQPVVRSARLKSRRLLFPASTRSRSQSRSKKRGRP